MQRRARLRAAQVNPHQIPNVMQQPSNPGHGPAETRSDWTIAQRWEHYGATEHAVWKTLFERQTRLLPGRACDAFVQGMHTLPMSAEQIPDFRRLSDVLMKHTGWQVVAVPGLVPDEVFFEHLANRRFPAGQFIRKPHELDYLEEPDVFDDVFGHVPMLMNPAIADYIQAYGVGGLRAKALGKLANLARVYWYTVEFGLVQQQDGVRIYGAGIASSFTESVFALDSASPNRIGFDLPRVMRPITASTTSRKVTSSSAIWTNCWRWRRSTSGRCTKVCTMACNTSPVTCCRATA